MKFNSVLVMVAAAFSLAHGAELDTASNEIAARAPEAQHGPPNGGGGYSSGGGSDGGSSGSSGSNNNDDDCDDDDKHCNSAVGRSLPVFGGVAGLAVAMAALL
ncbi:hypothetical protein Slin15195_G044780 [Septoria linicola]|uniref:Uncharacterized protein n=1 Tax=Septoria linicola TaxID=215465 RepID=A0A9Q9AN28_9PEZI|nr:hypothetical protein Slin14017_G048300 [Septoria linicola]USW51159.1 hypothetical protein Slin15195_G044780 [Septoria linicola]